LPFSVADPDTGSGAFLTLDQGSGMEKSGSGIRDKHRYWIRNTAFYNFFVVWEANYGTLEFDCLINLIFIIIFYKKLRNPHNTVLLAAGQWVSRQFPPLTATSKYSAQMPVRERAQ
jgi:hypothetical protein